MSRSHTPYSQERSHSSQGHERSEGRFLAMMREHADVFWYLSPDGSMREVCPSWHTFTGQRERECLGRGWLDALHPADQPQIEAAVHQAVASARSVEMECHIRRGRGAYRLVRVRAIPVREASGDLREVIACGTDITRQELAGQMSEAEVQLALKASGVGMWDWDLITNQINWTPQGKALLGVSPTTPLDYERFLAALYPEDRGPVDRFLARAVAEHADYQTEYRTLWPDGSIHWLSDRGHSISDTQGHPMHMVGALINITDLKQAEEALRQSREELHLLAETIPQLVWTAQPDGFLDSFNRQCTTYVNAPREELLGDRWLAFVHPEDRHRVMTLWETALQTGQLSDIEFRLREGKTGNYQWFLARATPLTDEQGHVLKWFGTATNIDEKKRAEEALQQSRDAFHRLTEALPQLLWIAHPDGFWEYANQQWYDYTGSDPEQTLGDGWVLSYHQDDQDKVLTLWKTSLLTRQSFTVEARIRQGQTGAYRWFLVRAVPLRESYDSVWRWVGTCTDIHEKKCTEEALRESEARFRRLVESNIIGIMISDLEGNVHEANDALLRLVGYTREDLAAGRITWTTITPAEYHARNAQALEELCTTGTFTPFEKEYVTKDGKRVPVLVGGALFRRAGSAKAEICFVLDLTARKEIERQKDLMLSMTSHELKTPLCALKGTFQLLERRVKRLGTQIEHLSPEVSAFFADLVERLAASARHVDVQTHLINDLLDVSRITANTLKLELVECDLARVVRETVEDLRVTEPERSLVLEVPEHPTVLVLADRARISQVVTNYVTNAIRYSSADQPIHIGLSIQEGVARVWVRDWGPGLTEEAKTQLWQRFHQVKGMEVASSSGKGVGLGLYICQTLIAQHQGEVGVESTPGEGSTFWFTLPVHTNVP